MKKLIYKTTGQPVKVGDKVPGKRLSKFYAHIQAIHSDCVELLYNGDVRNFRVSFDVIDAAHLQSRGARRCKLTVIYPVLSCFV